MRDHLGLVGHLAREAAARLPRHLDADDLVGAGSLALVQAARAFDPALGVPFARFASTRIRGAMIDHMRQRDWATRSVRSRARSLATAAEELTKALHRAPTDAELAAAAGMSEQEVRDVLQGTDRASLLSLDPLTVGDDGLGAGLEDRTPGPGGGAGRRRTARVPARRDRGAPGAGAARRDRLLPGGPPAHRDRRGAGRDPVAGVAAAVRGARPAQGGAAEAPRTTRAEGRRAGADGRGRPGSRGARRTSRPSHGAPTCGPRADVQAYLDGAPLRAPAHPHPAPDS